MEVLCCSCVAAVHGGGAVRDFGLRSQIQVKKETNWSSFSRLLVLVFESVCCSEGEIGLQQIYVQIVCWRFLFWQVVWCRVLGAASSSSSVFVCVFSPAAHRCRESFSAADLKVLHGGLS